MSITKYQTIYDKIHQLQDHTLDTLLKTKLVPWEMMYTIDPITEHGPHTALN